MNEYKYKVEVDYRDGSYRLALYKHYLQAKREAKKWIKNNNARRIVIIKIIK